MGERHLDRKRMICMSRELNPMQVWSQVPLANRTITVSDKTGFSLTAGSYSVRASSTQRGTILISNPSTSNTAAVSSVTTTRATETFSGVMNDDNGVGATPMAQDYLTRIALTSATVVTATRVGINYGPTSGFTVTELF